MLDKCLWLIINHWTKLPPDEQEKWNKQIRVQDLSLVPRGLTEAFALTSWPLDEVLNQRERPVQNVAKNYCKGIQTEWIRLKHYWYIKNSLCLFRTNDDCQYRHCCCMEVGGTLMTLRIAYSELCIWVPMTENHALAALIEHPCLL